MKAILCKKYGPTSDLVLEDIELRKPGTGEVHVEIKACSLNFPDTLMIQGLYQFKPPMPFSPGSDIAGIVKEVGEGVKHLKAGDEVFGVVGFGGFAQELIAPADKCFLKPPIMDFSIAASFMMTYNTSYHALKDRAGIKEGESLLVLGASGGVGLAAVELGKLMGARVIAAASSDEKLEICKQYGADEVINYSKEDLKNRTKELTNGKGVNVVLDPVGGDYTEAALRAIAWGGKVLIVGFPAGIAKIPMNLPLLKVCDIVGVFFGSFVAKNPKEYAENVKELMTFYAHGKLKPFIHHTYSLEEAPKALEDMMERRVVGKAVIVP